MEGKSGKEFKRSKPKSNIATLGSLNQQQESSSDEDGQAFYVGGSDRSGQQVIGPSRDKKANEDIVENMFKAVREQGAQVVEQSPPLARKKIDFFQGKGQKLVPDDEEAGTSSTVQPELDTGNPGEPITMRLKMWRNGFNVNDGPLRAFDDPANREFLSSISRGEVPRELLKIARNGQVSLDMEDHRHEEFNQVKKAVQAFTGEGFRLGAVTPETISSSESNSLSSDHKQDEESAKKRLSTDETKPSTSIQIRLADGTRLVIKVNLTHTIQDIRSYICEARPVYGPRPFVLMTSFPTKTLTDESLTIEEASLQNATLTQKLV